MDRALNAAQLVALRWVSDGMPGEATNSLKLSTRALANRSLAKVRGRGVTWSAELSDAGRHYLKHGVYPEGHKYGPKPPPPAPEPTPRSPKPTAASRRCPPPPPVRDYEVDSPRGVRERGRRPKGDGLFDEREPDPFDERILISVKEAAWMLSMTEASVHAAAARGDIDRVFLSEKRSHYRLVYGSMLAWVNDAPRDSARDRWWR